MLCVADPVARRNSDHLVRGYLVARFDYGPSRRYDTLEIRVGDYRNPHAVRVEYRRVRLVVRLPLDRVQDVDTVAARRVLRDESSARTLRQFVRLLVPNTARSDSVSKHHPGPPSASTSSPAMSFGSRLAAASRWEAGVPTGTFGNRWSGTFPSTWTYLCVIGSSRSTVLKTLNRVSKLSSRGTSAGRRSWPRRQPAEGGGSPPRTRTDLRCTR